MVKRGQNPTETQHRWLNVKAKPEQIMPKHFVKKVKRAKKNIIGKALVVCREKKRFPKETTTKEKLSRIAQWVCLA